MKTEVLSLCCGGRGADERSVAVVMVVDGGQTRSMDFNKSWCATRSPVRACLAAPPT